MNILMNLIIGIVLALIELYLIYFHTKNMVIKLNLENNTTSSNSAYIICYILLLISNCIINDYILKLFILIITLYIINISYKICIRNIIQITFTFLFLQFLTEFAITSMFSWLFNTSLSTLYINYFLSYAMLTILIEKYSLYFILSIYFKVFTQRNLSIFKFISIILFIYFGITIIFNNIALFYFPDVGRTFVFVIFISIASLIFFDRYQVKHEKIERDLIITTQNITKEKEYLKKYNDSADEIRKMRHNMHNDLNIIYGYLNSNEFDDAMKHVCHLLGDMNKTSAIIHVGHTSIDSIIDDKIKVMAAKDITYTEEIVSVNIGNIDVNTIAILIGLALDNAIEAAEKVDSGRKVKLEIMNRKNYLVLHIENSIIPGSHPTFNKTSKLTDPMNHGYGVKQINHIAKQYNGNAKFEVSHNFVTLKIILDMRLNEDPSL